MGSPVDSLLELLEELLELLEELLLEELLELLELELPVVPVSPLVELPVLDPVVVLSVLAVRPVSSLEPLPSLVTVLSLVPEVTPLVVGTPESPDELLSSPLCEPPLTASSPHPRMVRQVRTTGRAWSREDMGRTLSELPHEASRDAPRGCEPAEYAHATLQRLPLITDGSDLRGCAGADVRAPWLRVGVCARLGARKRIEGALKLPRVWARPLHGPCGMTTIFETLEQDHRELERLMDEIGQTQGDTAERKQLFETFGALLEAHSHAEERAFYSEVLADAETREKTAHGTKEHCEAADALEKLREADPSHGSWLQSFKSLREDVEHHIREEENELFPKARKVLSPSESETIGTRFDKLKRQERHTASA